MRSNINYSFIGALLLGMVLWITYLTPLFGSGISHLPKNWPIRIDIHDTVALTTYGKWLVNTPHNYMSDSFSGDFLVIYNYVSDLMNNILAKMTAIPPMVLQAVYIGPFLGFLFVVLNYLVLNKIIANGRIALLASVLIAFMGNSHLYDLFGIYDYYNYNVFKEFNNNDPAFCLRIFHLPFKILPVDQGGYSWGWILFLPTLVLLYLAYLKPDIKYKVLYGLLLGVLLQTHSLTFVNVLAVNLFYLSLHNLFLLWKNYKKSAITLVLLTLTTYSVLPFFYGFVVPPIYFVGGFITLFVLNFLFDRKKSFYLVSYSVFLVICLPYLAVIVDNIGFLGKYRAFLPWHIPLPVLATLYLPHLLATGIGLYFLSVGPSKHKELSIWLISILGGTFIMAYNHLLGWGNHPYRFAINLIFPMMILAAFGLFYGVKNISSSDYFRNMTFKSISLVLMGWFCIIIALDMNNYLHDRRPFHNFVFGSQDEYDFLKEVQQETHDGEYILTAPERSSLPAQTAILLNYSQSRGFLPDYRFILFEEKYQNRLKLFCFFFPSFTPDCEQEDNAVIQLEKINNAFIQVHQSEIKNTILNIYGIQYVGFFDDLITRANLSTHDNQLFVGNLISLSPYIGRQAEKFNWGMKADSKNGKLARVLPVNLPGAATFGRGQYHQNGFTAKFSVTKAGENVLIVAGNHLRENVNAVSIDGQQQTIPYRDNSILLVKTDLTIGEHELTISSNYSNRDDYRSKSDYIYFLNVIHESDVENYLSLGKVVYDFDFIGHLNEAKASNIYSGTSLKAGKELFTHPTAVPATLSYFNVPIKQEAKLVFGVNLRGTMNGVKYAVLVNGETVFNKVYQVPTQENNIIISLEKYHNQMVNVDFVVDPLGNNDSDWAYWMAPRICKISDPNKGEPCSVRKFDLSTLLKE